MSGRSWTEVEDAIVRECYRRESPAAIAARVGRSVKSVYQRANLLGVSDRQSRIATCRPLQQLVRQLNRQGLLDSEIAAEWSRQHPELPVDRRTLCDVRRRLRLPANANNERHRAQVAERTASQLAAAGVATLGALRAKVYREFGPSRGWPGYLRPRHVQILDLLYEHGPHTRVEICRAIGWNVARGQRQYLSNKYGRGSYLADLMAAGLVTRSGGREVRGPRKGTSVYRYYVTAGIIRGNPATWPEEEWSRGQIYGKKSVANSGAAGSGAATAGGANVPSETAGGRCRQRDGSRRAGDRRRDHEASQGG